MTQVSETATETTPSLGAWLKNARGKKSISAVARDAQISPAYLQKLEAGEVKQPSPNHLFSLSKALGLDYGELMRLAGYIVPGDVNRPGHRKQRNELTHALRSEKLTPEEAYELERYLSWYRERKAGEEQK